MNMFLRAILKVDEGVLIVRFIIYRTIFRCRASIACRRTEYLNRLVRCVGREFLGAQSFTGVQWHTQPFPGYVHDKPGGKRTSEICWEAPVGITIYLDEKPVLGMAVEFRGPHLCIRQLQGVAGVHLPDELKDWPARFVEGAMNFLCNTEELVSVRLYAADQRWSYKRPFNREVELLVLTATELKQYQQRLRRRYDGTARKMGFTRHNNRYYDWRAPVDETQTAD